MVLLPIIGFILILMLVALVAVLMWWAIVAAVAAWIMSCIIRPNSRRYGVSVLAVACAGGLWAAALVIVLADPQPTVLMAFRAFGAFVTGFAVASALGALVALPLWRKSAGAPGTVRVSQASDGSQNPARRGPIEPGTPASLSRPPHDVR
jgi:hypothetical protein